jgi:sulfate adenylyltransferase subunit 1 (EFTu-like GTPase family)
MDLAGYEEETFDGVVRDFLGWAARLDLHDVTFIPISALHGDNVVERSPNMDWYGGEPLLSHLESVPPTEPLAAQPARLPVQWVIRHDPRGYAGQIAAGILRRGDEVVVLPSGQRSRIAGIQGPDGALEEAFAPMSVAVSLEDDLDVSRGDLLARPDEAPAPVRELGATVCWVGDAPARAGARYLVKHTTRTVKARIESIAERLDVVTLDRTPTDSLSLNEIGRVRLRTGAELVPDAYADSRHTGSLILIDEATNDTVGAGLIERP